MYAPDRLSRMTHAYAGNPGILPPIQVTNHTLILATVIFAATLAGCGSKGAQTDAPAVSAVNVSSANVAVVQQTTITSGPAISGSLVADRTASIRAEVAGPVVAVLVDPGTKVAAGAPLVRIDDAVLRDAWLSARSGVTQAELAADLARRDQDRAEKLLAAGAIATNAAEQARRGAVAAQAMLDDARARLASAKKNLDNTVATAPYAGIVSERQANPGDIVAPGAPLVTVVDPSTMRFDASVPAEQLGAVRVGAPVKFSVTGYPGRSFAGTVSNVYPSADPGTRQVRLSVRIPNAGTGLVAGLFADGRIATASHSGLVVPLTAVDQRGLRPTVTRVRGGATELVEVELGARDEAAEQVELASGVAAGDTLLTGAAAGITPGTHVRIAATMDIPASRQPAQPPAAGRKP